MKTKYFIFIIFIFNSKFGIPQQLDFLPEGAIWVYHEIDVHGNSHKYICRSLGDTLINGHILRNIYMYDYWNEKIPSDQWNFFFRLDSLEIFSYDPASDLFEPFFQFNVNDGDSVVSGEFTFKIDSIRTEYYNGAYMRVVYYTQPDSLIYAIDPYWPGNFYERYGKETSLFLQIAGAPNKNMSCFDDGEVTFGDCQNIPPFNEIIEPEIELYPNPCSYYFTIEFDHNSYPEIIIYTINGSLFNDYYHYHYPVEGGNYKMNVYLARPGIYFVSVTENDVYVKTFKVISIARF